MRLWSNNEIQKGIGGFNPERRLLAAVLQRAITDYLSGDGEVQSSAQEWLFSDETGAADTFCFAYICEALDFHINELRKAITRQHDKIVADANAARAAKASSLTVTSLAA